MKTIQYLSPTSLQTFWKDKDEFYLIYLADERPIRIPQTKAMAIGSAFDAYCKSFLHEKLFGQRYDLRFILENLFEAQVEVQNRDWAFEEGKYVFECYKKSGALIDLMTELEHAVGTPRFEIEIKGTVNGYRDIVDKEFQDNVVLLGKPDVFYTNKHGARIILDWKVNGYLSNYTTSPMPGYLRIRGDETKTAHKDALPMVHNGMLINVAHYLETLKEDWAIQLGIYGWLCGENVGSEFICAIDQIVCKPNSSSRPSIRVAEHRLRIGQDFQLKTFAKILEAWKIVQSNHYFRNLSKEESIARCKLLDQQANCLKGVSDNEKWFSKIARE